MKITITEKQLSSLNEQKDLNKDMEMVDQKPKPQSSTAPPLPPTFSWINGISYTYDDNFCTGTGIFQIIIQTMNPNYCYRPHMTFNVTDSSGSFMPIDLTQGAPASTALSGYFTGTPALYTIGPHPGQGTTFYGFNLVFPNLLSGNYNFNLITGDCTDTSGVVNSGTNIPWTVPFTIDPGYGCPCDPSYLSNAFPPSFGSSAGFPGFGIGACRACGLGSFSYLSSPTIPNSVPSSTPSPSPNFATLGDVCNYIDTNSCC